MAYLSLNRIYKVYPNGVKAVNDFSIDIEDKEFIVFVGPSGCGKSTTLRMIAGLEEITAGELFLDGKLVNDVEAEDRDIAMVFQNYALYPHMTVYENMAFGLRNRKIKQNVIDEKIKEAVKILDLEDYLQKKPKEMSGGQRQRVALGRAIVRNPKVFLFDEPLSNLDAKLRASMRSEITKLHKRLKTTFIYVTHDQVEAMTMGTRIVVMKDGYVQQIDAPMNLYHKPVNKFVAGFIGTPQMNFFEVTLRRSHEQIMMNFNNKATYQIPFDMISKIDSKYLDGKHRVTLGVRPEHFIISRENTGLSLTVNVLEKLGNEIIVYGDLDQNIDQFKMSENTRSIIIKAPDDSTIEAGDVISLAFKADKIHFFDGDNEMSILKEVPDTSTFDGKVEEDCLSLFGSKIKLPKAYLDLLNDGVDVKIDIPPHALFKGSDFKLKVARVEQLEQKHLVHLPFNNQYLFGLFDKTEVIQDELSFSLRLDQLHLFVNDVQVLAPINDINQINGRLLREKIKENRKKKYRYSLLIDHYKLDIPESMAKQLIAVDGRHAFKKNYRLVLPPGSIQQNEIEGIAAKLSETFDYGLVKYAKYLTTVTELTIKVDENVELLSNVFLDIDISKVEIWHPNIDFRII